MAYAVRDAESFLKKMVSDQNQLFENVHTKLLTNKTPDKPDQKTIEDALNFLHAAKPEDTVILFLASHGISDTEGNYYFVPSDAIPEDLDRLFDGGKIESLISWQTFFDVFRLTAGKRLLVVDTCQAKNIEGRFDSHSLLKRSASSLFTMMLASKGNEESQEYPQAGHGLFTYSLLESLDRVNDYNSDGIYSVKELFSTLKPFVDEKRDADIGPQTPQLVSPGDVQDIPIRQIL